MANQQALEAIRSGYRLPAPHLLQQDSPTYKLMLSCWDIEPDKRPSFALIYQTLYIQRNGNMPAVESELVKPTSPQTSCYATTSQYYVTKSQAAPTP